MPEPWSVRPFSIHLHQSRTIKQILRLRQNNFMLETALSFSIIEASDA